MPNPEIAAPSIHPQTSFIFSRVQMIWDPYYLKILDPETVKEITLIGMRAELTAAQTYVKAVEDALKVVEKAKMSRG